MKTKIIKLKRQTLDVDKVYKNDFNLIKTIAQTRKMRNNNKTLEARKNNLKELMSEIDNEYQLNKNPSIKNLQESNKNFKNEYELFSKRANKKETKIIFKDLVKLYKSKGYRIPNFSIKTHNLFKINPLLEVNTDLISNGLLETQINKKKDDSEKFMNYLKKLGIILSGRISTDPSIQRSLMKKFNIPKIKIKINEEDKVDNIKKNIEMVTNLINSNALAKLETPKKKYKSISRQNSYASLNNNLNKKNFSLNKEKSSMSRRQSIYNNRVLKLASTNKFFERQNSNDSSNSNISISNNTNIFNKKVPNKDKSSENIYKKFNFTNNGNNGKNIAKTPKALNIPVINFQRISRKRDTNDSNISIIEKKQTLKFLNSLNGSLNSIKKNNEINRSNTINKNIINYNSKKKSNISVKSTIRRAPKNKNNNYPFFIKTQSNNESNNSLSDEFFFDLKSPKNGSKFNNSKKDTKKNDSYQYPYTSRNEFINYAFNKFSKRNFKDTKKYIVNYLSKVKGYENERIEIFINDIYDKNLKNSIKDLEKQVSDKDLYYKTERLYLNSHLIKRIKPLLNCMEERDNMIYRLEKNLADVVGKE